MPTSGHCLCGEVTYAYDGRETWACYCHCESCRRQTAAPCTAFIGLRNSQLQWTGARAKTFESSPGVLRHFCGTCGTPVAFTATHYPGETHIYAATLRHPERFQPKFHVHYQETLPYMHITDDLPKYPGSAPSNFPN